MDIFIITRIVVLFTSLFKIRTGNVFATISRDCGADGIKHLRRVEKLNNKLCTLKLDIWFLESCHELGIIPKFLAVKLSNVNARFAYRFRRAQERILLRA